MITEHDIEKQTEETEKLFAELREKKRIMAQAQEVFWQAEAAAEAAEKLYVAAEGKVSSMRAQFALQAAKRAHDECIGGRCLEANGKGRCLCVEANCGEVATHKVTIRWGISWDSYLSCEAHVGYFQSKASLGKTAMVEPWPSENHSNGRYASRELGGV